MIQSIDYLIYNYYDYIDIDLDKYSYDRVGLWDIYTVSEDLKIYKYNSDEEKRIRAYLPPYQVQIGWYALKELQTYNEIVKRFNIEDATIQRIDYQFAFKISNKSEFHEGMFKHNYSKINTITMNGQLQTVYFGSRKNGKVIRCYDKTEEMNYTKDLQKMSYYNNQLNVDIGETAIVVEIELHRKYLQKVYKDMPHTNIMTVIKKELEDFAVNDTYLGDLINSTSALRDYKYYNRYSGVDARKTALKYLQEVAQREDKDIQAIIGDILEMYKEKYER